jgi:hypothetical protein
MLSFGLFCGRESATFELALAGTVLALLSRRVVWLFLVVPWVRTALDCARGDWWPPHRWAKLPVKLILLAARHLVLVAGLAYGNARARRPVL